MEGLWMLPNFFSFQGFVISQTLFTAAVTTSIFLIVALMYSLVRKINPTNGFVMLFDMWLESLEWFIDSIADDIPRYAKVLIMFIFVYIFWNNILWVVWDMFALVVPTIHHYFRPVSTDILFNAIIAVFAVSTSLFYGLQHWWVHFVMKYFPVKWLGIVEKVKSFPTFIFKIFDILLWMFIWFLELIGEFAKMVSLSLRLFWNILAGVVLLSIWVMGANAIAWIILPWDFPILLPIVVFVVELFVWFLQAFVFTLLVIVYFKMAWASH